MSAKGNWYDRVTSQFVQNAANIYLQESGIPAFKIFPEVKSGNLKGKIAKYDADDWFYIGTVADYIRKGATESAGDDYTTDSQDYSLLQYSFHKDVTEDEANEYESPFGAIRDAVRFVLNRIRRVITLHLIQSYVTTGIWSDDLVGTTDFTKWSDASSTPVADVLKWQENIQKVTGFKPNRLLVAPDVHRFLKTNTAVTNIMKTTETKVVTNQLLAQLFEVDSYEILDTVNSGATGFMMADKLLLIHTPDNPSVMEPSAGYTITYRNSQNPLDATKTKRIEMETKNNAVRIEVDVHAAPIVLASDLGVYASDVV